MFINPFKKKPWISRVCSVSLLKILWEKEKLHVTSTFSFSHSVFYPFGELSAIFIKFEIVVCKLFQFGSIKNLSFGKELTNQDVNPAVTDQALVSQSLSSTQNLTTGEVGSMVRIPSLANFFLSLVIQIHLSVTCGLF